LEGDYVKADQRQHPRYRIRDVEFDVFSHGIRTTGKLVNISQGGLAFQFTPGPGKTAKCRAIDIMGRELDRIYLPAIAVRMRYDISVLAEDQSFSGAETRLRGVQFVDLTAEQTQKLTDLIDRYGIKLITIL
jgi:hypothetical protein